MNEEEEKKSMKEDTATIDNGSTEVQVAALGTIVGTGQDGQPVEQHFTEEALQAIASNQDDILVDVDHESEREGKTAAAGWLKKLHLVPGEGLFGKISWTDIGRKLVDNRVFRFLSPAFIIDKDTRQPIAMTSCALTNKPSQAGMLKPIINQAPAEEGNLDISTQEQEISDMDIQKLKKEIFEEILEALHEEGASMNACATAKADDTASKAVNEGTEMPVDEKAKLEAVEEMKEEIKEDAGTTEAAAEVKEPANEEVIRIESLNSSPAPTLAPQPEAWRNMSQKDFIQWIESGAYRKTI